MNRRGPKMSLEERLERFTEYIPESGCMVWLGAIRAGYGQMSITTPGRGRRTRAVHVVSWEVQYGPVPHGLQLDHKCRVRCCRNPDHLEAVTAQVNVLRGFGAAGINGRKTHCIHGHPFEGDNVFMIRSASSTSGMARACRLCYIEAEKRKVIAKRRKRQRLREEIRCNGL